MRVYKVFTLRIPAITKEQRTIYRDKQPKVDGDSRQKKCRRLVFHVVGARTFLVAPRRHEFGSLATMRSTFDAQLGVRSKAVPLSEYASARELPSYTRHDAERMHP